MQLTFLLSALVAFQTVVATIDNTSAAKAIQKASQGLSSAKYQFKNVQSGQWLTYTRDGQSLTLTSKPSWFSVQQSDEMIIVSPTDSNDKCISAQWDYKLGLDWAGMLYACAATSFSKRDDGPLREAKQYWYAHPAKKSANAWNFIAVDHIHDMATRALAGWSRQSRYQSGMQGVALVEYEQSNTNLDWEVYDKNGNQIKTSGSARGHESDEQDTQSAGTKRNIHRRAIR